MELNAERFKMFKAKFTYKEGEVVNAKFTSAKPKPINVVFKYGIDHNKLFNRDLPDQHPIDAITGLREAIDEGGSGLAQERQERIAADENLQQQIDDITINTLVIEGGSNIEVEKENNTVTINAATFIYEQGIASDTWVITHNLNKCPSITLVDSSGAEFQARKVYNNLNQVTIYLNGATTGKAYLN